MSEELQEVQAPGPELPETVEPETTESESADLGKPKAKTKAQLETELADLTSEISSLRDELERFKAAMPKTLIPKEGHTAVFVKSNNVAYIPEGKQKYVHGSVNGAPFKVLCDEQVEVADHVAEALRGVLEAQKG